MMMMMMTMILMLKMMMMKHDDDINDEWFLFLVNAADNVAYKGRNAPTMDPALHHLCMFLIIIAVFPFFTPCAGQPWHRLSFVGCNPLRRLSLAQAGGCGAAVTLPLRRACLAQVRCQSISIGPGQSGLNPRQRLFAGNGFVFFCRRRDRSQRTDFGFVFSLVTFSELGGGGLYLFVDDDGSAFEFTPSLSSILSSQSRHPFWLYLPKPFGGSPLIHLTHSSCVQLLYFFSWHSGVQPILICFFFFLGGQLTQGDSTTESN